MQKVSRFFVMVCCLGLLSCSENNSDGKVKDTKVLSPERVVKLSVDAALSGDDVTGYTVKNKALKKWARFTLETLMRDETRARVLVKMYLPDTAEIERQHGPIDAEKLRELGFDATQFNLQSDGPGLYQALIEKHYPEGTGMPMSTEIQEIELHRKADGWKITQP